MLEREDTRVIIDMRKTLNLGDYRPEEIRKGLQEYRQILAALFDSDRHRRKMGLANFRPTAVGQDWEREGSMLLVLFGSNEVGVSTVSHSWLSPVAVDLVESLLDSNRTVAYELCTKSSTVVEVLSRLIYQLLEKNPAAIRKGNNLQYVESQLSHEKDDKVTALRMALSKIINLQKDSVFIILDRPDLCDEESPAGYIETRLPLVEDAKPDLKIMLVGRSEFWGFEEYKGKHNQRANSKPFQKHCFDQLRQ